VKVKKYIYTDRGGRHVACYMTRNEKEKLDIAGAYEGLAVSVFTLGAAVIIRDDEVDKEVRLE
jgi:hypothetical protein